MASLNANQRSFVDMMQRSDEHAMRGFELLLERPEFLDYFDPLVEAGLFAADKNPAPVQADQEGRYRIPYWKGLDYLVAAAKVAGDRNDTDLAEKILTIIRTVSAARDPTGDRANFHTFRQFAEILGLLPTSSVTPADLNLVEGWLNARFDHDLVAKAIDDGALKRFLESSSPDDWPKAVQLFSYCTSVRWKVDRLDPGAREPITTVDTYWLKALVEHHAYTLGRKAGASAAPLMAERVREVFGEGGRADWSYVFRPAVEGDGQSHSGRGAENVVVEALREVLLGWIDADAASSKSFVDGLLRSDNEMLRRIGIHTLNERWELLEELYLPLVQPALFHVGHLHELYRLLNQRFESFNAAAKDATIQALREIPISESGEDSENRVQHLQFRWLAAIASTSFEPASKWFGELTAKYGSPPKYADYLSHIETRWGPGPSQYSAEELTALAEERLIVTKLAAFKPSASWEGPTIDALTDQLERAVQLAPMTFVRVLPDFLDASITYQHAVIAGFLKLWREPNADRPFDGWNDAWPRLFDFVEALLAREDFWTSTGDKSDFREVNPMWIASSVAALLQEGTRDDKRAYPSELLPRGLAILQTLLVHGERVNEPGDDPMFQAVNSTRGKAIEALFGHALRVCRIADKDKGSHLDAWNSLQPLFDQELEACLNGNFEFSTLAGAYSGNVEFLSADWLAANINKIFPIDRQANLYCSIGGLAYASSSRRIYRLLRNNGILDAALALDLKGRNGREKLIERIAVGYLWAEDSLDSSRFKFLFESRAEEDLAQINFFFWTIGKEELQENQVQRILVYWRRCLSWAASLSTPPAKVLSSLSGLASFLPNISGENCELLLATAPYVHEHHGAYEFISDLMRLAEGNPKETCAVLRKFIETHPPMYDYENRMRSLVARLADLGYRDDAIEFCDKLRSIPGLYQLFLELTAKPPSVS